MKELTDLEICKRIAEIEGVDAKIMPYSEAVLYAKYDEEGVRAPYNPLTDDALCFQLMVKYGAYLSFNNTVWVEGVQISSNTPNKAICLAIIEANK